MNIREYARETRGVLETKGWCKGEFENIDGNVCLMGAINSVRVSERNAYVSQVEIIREISHRLLMPPSLWNDLPETSYEDVILMLKEIEYEHVRGGSLGHSTTIQQIPAG